MQHIAIIGASGGIGHALCETFAKRDNIQTVYAGARRAISWQQNNIVPILIDPLDEASISAAAEQIHTPLDAIIIAIGMLHDANIQPEKSIRQVHLEAMQKIFSVNTFAPTMIMKYFLPKLNKSQPSVCAALSARVGSISDNRLGGWYSYRASKAALNMMIKCTSIEYRRINANSIIIGLHPGTVDSHLSKPFQANVPKEQLFSTELCAKKLIDVITNVTPNDTGRCFDYAQKEILP